jgi:hypothetical protein
MNAAFILTENQHMTVGRPSLAATNGGHGGQPRLLFLKDISGTPKFPWFSESLF